METMTNTQSGDRTQAAGSPYCSDPIARAAKNCAKPKRRSGAAGQFPGAARPSDDVQARRHSRRLRRHATLATVT